MWKVGTLYTSSGWKRPCARRRAALSRLRSPSLYVVAILLQVFGSTAYASTPVTSLLEMRQERVIVQKWDLSCGAAALATLLTYQLGKPVTERELALQLVKREEYLADPAVVAARQGFSLLDLKRVAEGRGYKGVGLGNLTLQDLIEQAPLIVPISLHGYNHFVVFRGVAGDQALLADPAWGNRTIPVEAFERAWIDYPQMGKLGFAVAPADGGREPNRLAPRPEDFVLMPQLQSGG